MPHYAAIVKSENDVFAISTFRFGRQANVRRQIDVFPFLSTSVQMPA